MAASPHMIDVLTDAVIEYAAFLDRSDDDLVHPDVAVKQMESLASTLKQLSSAELAEFLHTVTQRADVLRSDPVTLEFAQWLDQMPFDLGLLD